MAFRGQATLRDVQADQIVKAVSRVILINRDPGRLAFAQFGGIVVRLLG